MSIGCITRRFGTVKEKRDINAILVAAGAPDASFAGVVKAMLKAVAKKVAADSGEALMDKTSELLSPFIDAGMERITEKVQELFNAQ